MKVLGKGRSDIPASQACTGAALDGYFERFMQAARERTGSIARW